MSSRKVEEKKTDALEHKPLAKPEEIQEIIDRVANRPARDVRSADEIVGYDENGLPS